MRIDRRGAVEEVRGIPPLVLAFGLSPTYNRTATNIEAHHPNDVNATTAAGSPAKPPIVSFLFCGPIICFVVISPNFPAASSGARNRVEELSF